MLRMNLLLVKHMDMHAEWSQGSTEGSTCQVGGPGQAAALERLRKAGQRDVERVAHGVDDARARQHYLRVAHVVVVAQHLVHDARHALHAQTQQTLAVTRMACLRP